MILEEARKYTIASNGDLTSDAYEKLLSRPSHYARLNCFPKETKDKTDKKESQVISAIFLATTARTCFTKFKKDYRIGGFINLLEWRSFKRAFQNSEIQEPHPQDHRVIINDNNVFKPSPLQSMQVNSEHLSMHLKEILCLSIDDTVLETTDDALQADRLVLNTEIIEYATQHDLPIFISTMVAWKRG